MKRVYPALRVGTALLCAYESASILTRRTPTLSELSARYPALAPALIAALTVHLIWPWPMNLAHPTDGGHQAGAAR